MKDIYQLVDEFWLIFTVRLFDFQFFLQGESLLKDIVCTTLNDIIFVLISCFDMERLSSAGDMQAAATSLLHCRKVCEDFWLQPDQGVNLIWKEAMAQFPVEIIPLLELAKAVAQTSSQNKIQVSKMK